MAFPASPTNGQQHSAGGYSYTYSTATNTWVRDAPAGGAAIANNLTETAAGSVLDATQGKILDDKITANDTDIAAAQSDITAAQAELAALANGMTFQGDWDASSGTFPGGGTAQQGAFYNVSVGGTVDGVVFDVNDAVIATTDNASTSTYAANWSKRDATDAVQTVNGEVGAVEVVKSSSQATPPASPNLGDEWFNTVDSLWYKWTIEGANSFWLNIQ